jgi:hypothetical protein
LKKFLKSTALFIKDIFLQVILAFAAFISWTEASDIGRSSEFHEGTYTKKVNEEYVEFGTSVDMNSGFIGGSISMGLICSVCIVMIVWIQINKKNN